MKLAVVCVIVLAGCGHPTAPPVPICPHGIIPPSGYQVSCKPAAA